MCIAFSKIALHRTGEKKTQRRMVRYDGFTLKKKIRDNGTDEALEHVSVLDTCRPMHRG
jgi:hypothetical protein